MLENKSTVTAKWYTEMFLPQVFESLRNLRPNSELRYWILHHDNALAHRASKTIDFLEQSGIKIMDHPLIALI
jgi:hypothetical protein